jgi:hypothetical protein|tara:strand:- start:5982 stop:6227 length:246 start_codon:yes stop_codon:yes gene_type:complete
VKIIKEIEEQNMARVLGVMMGLGILVLAALAFQDSLEGRSNGYLDIGFWWGVISLFLTIAGLSAIVGTFIHTQKTSGSDDR